MPILTSRARLAGVIGWPVSHSRSPLLHNHWLAQLGLDGAYVPLPVRAEDFSAAVAGLRVCGFAGANVTLPHKSAAHALCDTLHPSAVRAGAVNTLIFHDDGRIEGANTDGTGFVASLADAGIAAAQRCLVLGAGGAARAVAAALQDAGADVTLCNRSRARADALAATMSGMRVIDWPDRNLALADHSLLVNTTSLGMHGQPPLPIDLGRNAHLAVADIVYVPLETELILAARALGCPSVGGLGMLIHQARLGFAAWFGATPPADAAAFDLLARDIARP